MGSIIIGRNRIAGTGLGFGSVHIIIGHTPMAGNGFGLGFALVYIVIEILEQVLSRVIFHYFSNRLL